MSPSGVALLFLGAIIFTVQGVRLSTADDFNKNLPSDVPQKSLVEVDSNSGITNRRAASLNYIYNHVTAGRPKNERFSSTQVLHNCKISTRYQKGIGVFCWKINRIPTAKDLQPLIHNHTVLSLTFDHVGFQKLLKSSFITYPELQILSIFADDIAVMESGAFQGLGQLRSLTIKANFRKRPVEISEEVFQPLPLLKNLNLTLVSLSVSSIQRAICSVSSELTHLVLDHVFLYSDVKSVVEIDTFFDCLNTSNLQVLSMNRNDIVRISKRALIRFRGLRCISFRNNKILGDRAAFYDLIIMPNLTWGDFGCQNRRGCAKPTLFPDHPSPYYPCLYKIDIATNLEKKVFTADVEKNATLMNLHRKIHILPNLRFVRLDHIEGSAIDVNLERTPVCVEHIETVDLSYMAIRNVTGQLQCAEHLKYINVRGIKPAYIDKTILNKARSLVALLLNDSSFGDILLNPRGGYVLEKNPNITYLELSNNGLNYVKPDIFRSLTMLKTLLLNENRLQEISVSFKGLVNIENIDFSGNDIRYVDQSSLQSLETIQRQRPEPKIVLDLRNNPLVCSCKNLQTFLYLRIMKVHIVGLYSAKNPVTCINETGHEVPMLNETSRLCTQCAKIAAGEKAAFSIYMICLITFIVGAIIFRHKNLFQYYTLLSIYMFSREREREHKRQYIFDAFISYHHSDVEFTHRNIIDELEARPGEKRYSLCVHERNFRPGTPISVNIVEAILKSKKTILCVSPSYLKSGWCEFETNFAHSNSITWHESNVILLVHPAVLRHGKRRLPLSLVALLDTVTYLEWPTDDYSRKIFLLKLRQTLGTPLERPANLDTVLLL